MQDKRTTGLSVGWTAAILAGLTVLALALRLVDLGSSFWADEMWTRYCAVKGLRWSLSKWGVSLNPGYMYMPVGCGALFGYGEAALRLPSLAAGVLAVPALFGLLNEIHGRRAGLIGALLLSVNAYHVYYSAEARMYSCVMLGALLAVWTLYRSVTRGGAWNWLLYLLSCLWVVPMHLLFVPFLFCLVVAAGLYKLQSSRGRPRRERCLELLPLAVCSALALSSLAMFMALAGYAPTIFVSGWHSSGQEVNGILPSEIDLAAEFRLSPTAFVGFVCDFTGVQPLLFQAPLLVLGVWGFWYSRRRLGPLTWLAASAFILLPGMAFLVKTTHFWASRHFCFLLPLAVAGIALGLDTATGLAGRYAAQGYERLRDGREWMRLDEPAARRLFLGFLLALLVFPASGALVSAYDRRPVEDAKGVSEYMDARISANDRLCFFNEISRFWTEMALRDSAGQERAWLRTPNSVVAENPSRENLGKFVASSPEQTLWFIKMGEVPADYGDLLAQLGTARKTFRGADVWVLGAPTVNLIPLGGAETPRDRPELAGLLARGAQAYSGEACYRITNQTGKGAALEFSVDKPGYWLRNPGFEVRTDHGFTGWTVRPRDAAGSGTPHEQGLALDLMPRPQEVIAEQCVPLGLAPGRKITVQAEGRAAKADDLFLECSYSTPGADATLRTAHPGGGEWKRMALEIQVPEEAYPESFRVRFRLSANAASAAAVDNASVVVPAIRGELDPQKEYCLSLMVKYDRLVKADASLSANFMGKLSLVWYDPVTRSAQNTRLDQWAGRRDWNRMVFPITPGIQIPLGITYLKAVVSLASETVAGGAICVDEVQFEAMPNPTPFVQGRRPPHDEALAALQ